MLFRSEEGEEAEIKPAEVEAVNEVQEEEIEVE